MQGLALFFMFTRRALVLVSDERCGSKCGPEKLLASPDTAAIDVGRVSTNEEQRRVAQKLSQAPRWQDENSIAIQESIPSRDGPFKTKLCLNPYSLFAVCESVFIKG